MAQVRKMVCSIVMELDTNKKVTMVSPALYGDSDCDLQDASEVAAKVVHLMMDQLIESERKELYSDALKRSLERRYGTESN